MIKVFSLISRHWLVLVGIVAFVFLVGGLKKLFSSSGFVGKMFGDSETEKLSEVKNEQIVKAAKPNDQLTTRTPAQLKQIAETQYKCMGGLGTDENVLFSSLMGCNSEDLKGVAYHFGIREWGSLGMGGEGTIFVWYEDELATNLLQKMRNVWSGTGLWS